MRTGGGVVASAVDYITEVEVGVAKEIILHSKPSVGVASFVVTPVSVTPWRGV